MKSAWRTAWQGSDIVVYQDEREADRLPAGDIERVVLVQQGTGDTPGDLEYALVQMPGEVLLLPADTGFAGRVNFERQAFWAERRCVYWVSGHKARLPLRHRGLRWTLGLSGPRYARIPKDQVLPAIEHWPLEGPQTWEQRKWQRIEDARPFGSGRTRSL